MKKAFALILALAMVMSLAAVSFAATALNPADNPTNPAHNGIVDPAIYTYSSKDGYTNVAGTTVPFGKTVYVRFTDSSAGAIDNDAVKGLKVDAKWEKGGEYIADVEIVKVGNTKNGENYAIAFETTGSSLKTVNVLGEVSVKGKSYYEADTDGDNELEDEKASIKFKFEIELDLGYPEVDVADDFDVGEDATIYDFGDDATPDEVTITFGPVTAEVETKSMKKVVMSYNDDEDEDILDANVEADIEFINCVGTFRRTTEVTIDAEDYQYLYEVVDGKLVEVDAEYDEWAEEFTFKTRKLGNYVLSDMELDTAADVVATNPTTGAAA